MDEYTFGLSFRCTSKFRLDLHADSHSGLNYDFHSDAHADSHSSLHSGSVSHSDCQSDAHSNSHSILHSSGHIRFHSDFHSDAHSVSFAKIVIVFCCDNDKHKILLQSELQKRHRCCKENQNVENITKDYFASHRKYEYKLCVKEAIVIGNDMCFLRT